MFHYFDVESLIPAEHILRRISFVASTPCLTRLGFGTRLQAATPIWADRLWTRKSSFG